MGYGLYGLWVVFPVGCIPIRLFFICSVMDVNLEFDDEFRNEIKFQKKYLFMVVAISGFFITIFTCVGCFIQCAILAEKRFSSPILEPRPLPTSGYNSFTTIESNSFSVLANKNSGIS